MEGIVILRETIHEMHHKKLSGVLFKIDFEKSYDKVNWFFISDDATERTRRWFL
jgi:hypothetical protein